MASESTAEKPVPPVRRRGPAFLLRMLLAVLLCLVIIALSTSWLLGTPSGARFALQLAARAAGSSMQIGAVHGRLLGPLAIDKLVLGNATNQLHADSLTLDWDPAALRQGLLHIRSVELAGLVLALPATNNRALSLPASLRLPLSIQIDNIHLAQLRVTKDKLELVQIDDAAMRWHFNGKQHQFRLASLRFHTPASYAAEGKLAGTATLDGDAPFALKAHVDVSASSRHAEAAIPLEAKGSISLDGNLSAINTHLALRLPHPAQLTAQALVQPFAQSLLQQATLQLTAVNLAALQTAWPQSRLDGQALLSQRLGRTEFQLDVQGPVAQAALKLQARGQFDQHSLHVAEASLAHRAGLARFAGMMEFSGARKFSAQGHFQHFNLQALGPFSDWPHLNLNGEFNTSGKLQAQPEVALQFLIRDSQLHGQPLHGKGELSLSQQSLSVNELTLVAGANTLHANGALQENQGALQFSLEAPQLSQLGPGFKGALQLKGSAKGRFDAPALSLQWQAQKVQLPNAIAIGQSAGNATLQLTTKPSPLLQTISAQLSASRLRYRDYAAGTLQLQLQASAQSSAPMLLDLRAQQLVWKTERADNVQLQANGRFDAHQIFASLAAGKEQLVIEASGKLRHPFEKQALWQAQLNRIESSGSVSARLQEKTALTLSANGISVGAMTLLSSSGNVIIHGLQVDQQGWQSKGELQQIDLAQGLPLLKKNRLQSTNLRFDGNWDLRYMSAADFPLQGELSVKRTSGDLILDGHPALALGLQQLSATLRARKGKMDVILDAAGTTLGKLSFQAGVKLKQRQLLPDLQATINGQLQLQLPSIAWIAALLSPNVLLEGRAASTLQIAGSIAEPRISGPVSAQQLRVVMPASGLELKDGNLDAEFSGNTLTIRQLRFSGSSDKGGSIAATGPVSILHGQPQADLRWRAEKFSLFNRVDRKLVASGDGHVSLQNLRARVEGEILIDSGLWDLGSAETPQLSDDVIIAGRNPAKSSALQLDLDLGVALGQQFLLRGRGIKGKLGGAVRLSSKAGTPLNVVGLMQISRGSYTAYGRELSLERGILRFDGPPGNPALDILAMRRGTEVEAGVAIGGSALAPRVMLVSDPTVPDAEKLSWLVLGQSLSTANGADAGALQGAAAALLSQGAAASVQSQIATVFGLDTISISKSQDSLQQRVITLGKRVSSKLMLSYQQGLQTAGAAVLIRYTLSPRLTLEAEAGNRNIFSLFYNIRFD